MSSPERAPSRGILLAVAGLAWAAAMLLSARISVTGTEQAELEVVAAAYAMPGTVSASLVAGLAVALTVLTLLPRGRELGATVRFAIATGVGLVVGLLGAVSIITINTEGWIYAVFGGTIAAAATIGGAAAGFRHARVVSALGWAAITVFLVGVVLAFLQDDLLPVFGAGGSSASYVTAAGYWGYAQGILSGLASGLVTYLLLRRTARRTGSDVRWPFYALAAAGPGLLLIVAEILTRVAGARVLSLAGKVSELDSAIQQVLSTSRLNNGLMVLFIGAFFAIIAVGRTLKGPTDEAPAPEAASAGRSNARSRTAAGSGRPARAATPELPVPPERVADPEAIERAARAEEEDEAAAEVKPIAGAEPSAGAKPAAGAGPVAGAKPIAGSEQVAGAQPAAGAEPVAGGQPVEARGGQSS